LDCKSRYKKSIAQIIGEKFSTFSSFSKNPASARLFGDEIGCKDRKSFEYDNSFRKKYGNYLFRSPTVPGTTQRMPVCASPSVPDRNTEKPSQTTQKTTLARNRQSPRIR
jgi:hypothetical protein